MKSRGLRAGVLIVVGLVFVALAWLGIKGGLEQWPQSNTVTRRVQTLAQFAYGLLSLVILLAAAGKRQTRVIAISWLACITVAGGLGPVAWADTGWGPSIAAAVASFVVGWLIWWLFDRAVLSGIRLNE